LREDETVDGGSNSFEDTRTSSGAIADNEISLAAKLEPLQDEGSNFGDCVPTGFIFSALMSRESSLDGLAISSDTLDVSTVWDRPASVYMKRCGNGFNEMIMTHATVCAVDLVLLHY
jgi:hypothetical protein